MHPNFPRKQAESTQITTPEFFPREHRFPRSDFSRSIVKTRRMTIPTPRQLLTLCLLACTLTASAQTLARPGWVGSGMASDAWWRHAVFYRVNPAKFTDSSNLQGVAQHLDYIRSLGVDGLLLTPIQPDPTHAQAIDPALGTFDDLDDLIHEASRRNIRVLLDLPPGIPSASLTNVARFWLNRGIAGFHVTDPPSVAHSQIATLRAVTNSFLGQRIVISDLDLSTPLDTPAQSAARPRSRSPLHPSAEAQLTLDLRPGDPTQLTASAIRPAIDATQDVLQAAATLPLIASDSPSLPRSLSRYGDGQHDLAIAKILAAILLTTRADTLLLYGQELGLPSHNPLESEPHPALMPWGEAPKSSRTKSAPTPVAQIQAGSTPSVPIQDADQTSLLNWYRQLSALRHGNATITNGVDVTLNHDDQNVLAWIRRSQNVSALTPAFVVLCNLSAQPVQLDLKPDMERLHLRGSFLRTILRTDNGRGPMHLESITLAPYAVYIGQIRY